MTLPADASGWEWLLHPPLLALAAWALWRRVGQRGAGPLRLWFWPTLGARLVGGVALGVFYQHQFADNPQPGGDTFAAHRLSVALTAWAPREPGAYVRLLLTAAPPPVTRLGSAFRARPDAPFAPYTTVYVAPYSNSWFFVRLLSLLNFLTGSSYWLNALWLSLAAFAGAWFLARELTRLAPAAWRGALLGGLAWPAVVFFYGGVSKDALLAASLGTFTAVALRLIYPLVSQASAEQAHPSAPTASHFLVLLLAAWLLWKIKFFLAAAAFVTLGALALTEAVRRRWPAVRPWQVFVGAAVALAPLSRILHRAFRPEYLLYHLPHNQADLQARSTGQPQLLLDLHPTLGSFLLNLPRAVVGTFTRPWPWEGSGLLWRVAGLENAALLALLALTLLAWGRRGFTLRLPLLAGALLTLVVVGAAMFGLATPNLGTLFRYRAALLPFLVFLLDWGRVGEALRSTRPAASGSRGQSS